MRLEAKAVRDREIGDFREALAQCLAGTFEGTPEADEARFLQIEKLIARLRDEERWRNKVTDVRRWFDFAAREFDDATDKELRYYEDSTGQSGGEKAKLAFTILVAAIAYQYDLDPGRPRSDRFHFVVVDEMFSKVDDQYSEYALQLFEKFGLQLLIVAPLDAKARVTEPYVGCYLHVVKNADTNCSEVLSMTAREFEQQVALEPSQDSPPVHAPRCHRRARRGAPPLKPAADDHSRRNPREGPAALSRRAAGLAGGERDVFPAPGARRKAIGRRRSRRRDPSRSAAAGRLEGRARLRLYGRVARGEIAPATAGISFPSGFCSKRATTCCG